MYNNLQERSHQSYTEYIIKSLESPNLVHRTPCRVRRPMQRPSAVVLAPLIIYIYIGSDKWERTSWHYLLHFFPSRYNLIPVTGLFPVVTWWLKIKRLIAYLKQHGIIFSRKSIDWRMDGWVNQSIVLHKPVVFHSASLNLHHHPLILCVLSFSYPCDSVCALFDRFIDPVS